MILWGRTTLVTTLTDGAKVASSYVNNTTTTTDQVGSQRTLTSDGLGRLRSVVEYPGSGSYTTSYSYDALANLTNVSQSGLQRTFAYDSLSRLIAAFNPENSSAAASGTFSCAGASGSNWTMCYSCDNVGNLLSKIDKRGFSTSFAYDSLNRLTSKSYSSGSVLNLR